MSLGEVGRRDADATAQRRAVHERGPPGLVGGLSGHASGATVGATIRATVSPAVGPTVSPTVGPTIGPTIGTATSPTIGTTVGTTVSPTVSPTVVLTGDPTRATIRRAVLPTAGTVDVVVAESHLSSLDSLEIRTYRPITPSRRIPRC